MSFLFTKRGARSTPEQEFWTWFQDNETMLYDFEKNPERVFDRLASALKRVHRYLTFEFGRVVDGRREVAISAEGIKEAFPKVISLVDAAPDLPRWKVVKFRQRGKIGDLSIGEETIRAKDVLFAIEPVGERVNITLFLPEVVARDADAKVSVGFILLDNALGEFDVATGVKSVSFTSSAAATGGESPLEELPVRFDEYLTRSKRPA